MNIDLVKAAKVNNEAVDNLIDEARKKVESNDLIERLVQQLDRLRGQPLYSQRALIVRQADEIKQLKEKIINMEKQKSYERRKTCQIMRDIKEMAGKIGATIEIPHMELMAISLQDGSDKVAMDVQSLCGFFVSLSMALDEVKNMTNIQYTKEELLSFEEWQKRGE